MTTKEKEIFTTEEAAEMMGCSPSTIEEHARNRVLPGLRMGHEWRFPREAFMKAINTLAITGELRRTTKKRAVQAVASTKERKPGRRTGAGLADVIRRPGSRAVLALRLPELGIRSRRRHADG